jgi:hypothetical protein
VKAKNQFAVEKALQPLYQAEVLVPSPVPPHLIKFPDESKASASKTQSKKRATSSRASAPPTVGESLQATGLPVHSEVSQPRPEGSSLALVTDPVCPLVEEKFVADVVSSACSISPPRSNVFPDLSVGKSSGICCSYDVFKPVQSTMTANLLEESKAKMDSERSSQMQVDAAKSGRSTLNSIAAYEEKSFLGQTKKQHGFFPNSLDTSPGSRASRGRSN